MESEGGVWSPYLVGALGQGNYDAIAGVLGLVAGSCLFAETSGYLSGTIQRIGERGKLMRPERFGMRLGVFLPLFVALLTLALFALERGTERGRG